MEKTLEERISRLLDQLENSALHQSDIDRIQSKIEFLESLKTA